MIVVSDTSPIRALAFIEHLTVLQKLFGTVVIPPAVVNELAHPRGWCLTNLPRNKNANIRLAAQAGSRLLPSKPNYFIECGGGGGIEVIHQGHRCNFHESQILQRRCLLASRHHNLREDRRARVILILMTKGTRRCCRERLPQGRKASFLLGQ